jgi:hypothetical protein
MKRNAIVMYRPSPAPDSGKSEPIEFDSTEQLLAVDFVAAYTQREGFLGFTIWSDLLLAKFSGRGREVVGYLRDSSGVDLPTLSQPVAVS